MKVVHDFKTSLARSHSYADATWWTDVYRQAFPTMVHAHDVRQDGWAQRAGVDRQILLRDGTMIEVDEKVREIDYGDIFLEYWSDWERRIHGWVAKDLKCDFIAYAVAPTRTCYLLPFPLLRRAWNQHGRSWVATYGRKEADNGHYVTFGVAVPVGVLLGALKDSMVITWQAEAA